MHHIFQQTINISKYSKTTSINNLLRENTIKIA